MTDCGEVDFEIMLERIQRSTLRVHQEILIVRAIKKFAADKKSEL